MEFQICHQLLCGSVYGRVLKRDNGHYLASGILNRRKLSPGTHPDVRFFHFSLYATSALQAAGPVLEPRGNESVSPKTVVGLLRGDS